MKLLDSYKSWFYKYINKLILIYLNEDIYNEISKIDNIDETTIYGIIIEK